MPWPAADEATERGKWTRGLVGMEAADITDAIEYFKHSGIKYDRWIVLPDRDAALTVVKDAAIADGSKMAADLVMTIMTVFDMKKRSGDVAALGAQPVHARHARVRGRAARAGGEYELRGYAEVRARGDRLRV